MRRIIQEGSLQRIPDIPQELKDVFVTSMDIAAKDHILMQSVFQVSNF
jgi:ribonucleoside-diphosphate reductase alpha chain